MKKSSSENIIHKAQRVEMLSKVKNNWEIIFGVIRSDRLGFGNTLLDWTVVFGCYELFRLALNKMTTFERKMILGRYSIKLSCEIMSLLHLAILGGSLEIVADLVCHGANLNFCSSWFEPPIHLAMMTDRYDMVCLLLRHGAQISLRTIFAHHAKYIENDVPSNNQQVNTLINACIEFDKNQTELHKALRQNDLEKLRSSIRPETINLKTKRGLTALHYAVLLNNLEAVKVLFYEELPEFNDTSFPLRQDRHEENSKPKVNICDNNGLTAVHLAVIMNNIEIVSLLLRNKADVKVIDDMYRTPLHYTTNDKATKLLLKYNSPKKWPESLRNEYINKYEGSSISAFRTTCFNLTLQTAFRFVFRDFVNLQDKNGNTPLHCVIERDLLNLGGIDLIETLIKNGANPYLFNNRCISAVELFENRDDTNNLLPSTAKHRQLIQNFHKGFASVTFLLALTFLVIFYFLMISAESKSELHCVGEVTETDLALASVTVVGKLCKSRRSSGCATFSFSDQNPVENIGLTKPTFAILVLCYLSE
ncbi:unnamed protein product [Mytilus edulis]|uniref:Uncharacterized protein n=1 Tax=Mytilus edulis TaxID=6550 RepID=A0A8S3SXP0_MYTED|nr:unnamed protein product [Mytilus edulis]